MKNFVRNRIRRSILAATAGLALAAASLSPAAADAPGLQVQIQYQGLALNGWLTDVDSPVATVLMLHGTLAHGNMEIMRTFAEVLAEQDIETLRVTLSLGQDDREGMYDCQSPHRHRHGDAVGELGAWLAWLDENGRGKVVLLGHSRGTNQVARRVASQPGSGPPMVLVAPSVYRPGAAAGDEDRSGALAEASALVAAGDGETLMDGVGILYCPDADATAESLLSYHGEDSGFDTLGLAAGAQVPVLVVIGSEDPLSEGVAEALAGMGTEDRITLLEIDGADHFFRDLYAYDVAEGIREWLDGMADR